MMREVRIKKYIVAAQSVLLALVALSANAQQAPWVGESLDGRTCTGGDPGNYGPFDYRIDKDRLPVVEAYHFTPEVEQLISGVSAAHPMGEIRYTLTRFPNHHRALYSAVRFSLGESSFSTPETRMRFPAECYLQRAIRFTPTDSVVYMLYGLYLHRLGSLDQSLEMYQRAEELAPSDPSLQYNLGLLHFDNGNYEESYRYAKQAYGSGIELPGLRRRLEESGHWK